MASHLVSALAFVGRPAAGRPAAEQVPAASISCTLTDLWRHRVEIEGPLLRTQRCGSQRRILGTALVTTPQRKLRTMRRLAGRRVQVREAPGGPADAHPRGDPQGPRACDPAAQGAAGPPPGTHLLPGEQGARPTLPVCLLGAQAAVSLRVLFLSTCDGGAM